MWISTLLAVKHSAESVFLFIKCSYLKHDFLYEWFEDETQSVHQKGMDSEIISLDDLNWILLFVQIQMSFEFVKGGPTVNTACSLPYLPQLHHEWCQSSLDRQSSEGLIIENRTLQPAACVLKPEIVDNRKELKMLEMTCCVIC